MTLNMADKFLRVWMILDLFHLQLRQIEQLRLLLNSDRSTSLRGDSWTSAPTEGAAQVDVIEEIELNLIRTNIPSVTFDSFEMVNLEIYVAYIHSKLLLQ